MEGGEMRRREEDGRGSEKELRRKRGGSKEDVMKNSIHRTCFQKIFNN